MLLAIRTYMRQTINNMSVRKMPLYLLSAFVLFYFAPTLSIFSGIATAFKVLFALSIAPFVFEVLSRTFGWEARIARIVPLVAANTAQIAQDIRLGIDNRAILALNHVNSVDALVNLGLTALSNRNIEVFNAIVMRLQTLAQNAPAHANNRLLRAAVYHHRADCVRVLLNNEAVRNNAHALNNQALKEVCRNGNIEIFEDLMLIPSVINNATHNHNEALRIAESEEHYDIIARLLTFPRVAAYEVPEGVDLDNFSPRNEDEFQRNQAVSSAPVVPAPVVPDINTRIRPQNNEFNNLLNNLLRQNFAGFDRTFQDILSGTRSTRRQPRRERASHYDADAFVDNPNDNELNHVANHGEGSMQPLNARQQQALSDMQDKYRDDYNRKGEDVIFREIREYLVNEYNLNPARSRNGMHTLSLQRDLWNMFSNDVPYYQHHVHTAYRYMFLNPNPWRAPGGRDNELTIEDKTNIAYMWLAATTTNPIPDGQTRESLLTEFVTAIYELCRAHNFDRTRPVTRTRRNPATGFEERYVEQENYDDLEGDKPTCGGGVKQRSLQFYMVFLNDRPETRPLSPDVMRTTLIQQMINESTTPGCMYAKLKDMSTESLNKAYAALENKYILWDDITPEDQILLDKLNLTEDDIDSFINHCNTYFGGGRIAQERRGEEKLKLGNSDKFNTYEALIRHLANDAVGKYCDHIMRNITNIVVERTGNKPPSAEERMSASPVAPVVFSNPQGGDSAQGQTMAASNDVTHSNGRNARRAK